MARVKRGVWHGTLNNFSFGLPPDKEYIPELDINAQIYNMLNRVPRHVNPHGTDVENPALAFPDVNNPMHAIACKLQRAWLHQIKANVLNGTLQKRGRHVA